MASGSRRGGDLLTRRQLNRATLARQLLLERATMPVADAVTHLVGLQAQIPENPYVGLWSRLEGFHTAALSDLLLARAVVRIVLMRGTIHLVTADDCLELRPLVQPVLDRELANHRDAAPGLRGVDLAPVLEQARVILAASPSSGTELRAALAKTFPTLDAAALAYACRNHLALVQVPPRGVWGRRAQVRSTTAESWLGRPLATDPSLQDLVLRYLAAFGPALAADVAAWTGLTGLRPTIEAIRPRLRTFRDERGRELLDVPGAPLPDADVVAPARLLPEYDNLWLAFADRARFTSEDHGAVGSGGHPVKGTALHDGAAVGTWWIDLEPGHRAVLEIDHVARLARPARDDIAAEALGLLALVHPDLDADARFVAMT